MLGTATSESIIHQTFFFRSFNQSFPSSKRYITRLAHEEEAFAANLRDSARRQTSISRTESSYSPERYDWRLQATSRPRRATLKSKAEDKQSFAFIKRIKLKPPQPPLSESSPYYSALSQYKSHFYPLLKHEQDEEESVIRERLSTWSLAKLKDEGFTLTGLSAYWLEGTRFGKPMASFSLGPGLYLPEHKFLNGTPVLLSRIDPLKEEPSRGSVLSTTSTHLTISFPDRSFSLDLPNSSGWRIDLTENDYIFELMRTAIESFGSDVRMQEKTGSFLSQSGSEERHERALNGTHLRDVLLRSFQPSERPHAHRALQDADDTNYVEREVLEHDYHPDHLSLPTGGFQVKPPLDENRGIFRDNILIQSWASRYSRSNPVVVEGDPHFEELGRMNETQKRAMAMMLGERISLVQGPPGTGKTLTIISTVKLLKVHFQVPQPLLVCTYTNVAVDNLVEGLAKAGLKPLRAASAGKTKESLVKWTLEHQLQSHTRYPDWKELEDRSKKIKETLNELENKTRSLERKLMKEGLSSRETLIKKNMQENITRQSRSLDAITKRLFGLEQVMVKDILDNADVICTTCLTSASAALNAIDFPVVFLDEASMSTEPASLIPLMKGSRHVALIGDHKQLPPVITSPEARSMGLAVSLFERLAEEGVVPSIMLNIQYRMHPAISHFPSLEFYNSSLLDGTADTSGYVLPRLMPPTLSPALLPPGVLAGTLDSKETLEDGEVRTSARPPVIFLDHSGNESSKSKSRVNWHEAAIVASVVEDLLLNNDNLKGQDIGIIAPYVAQISLLTKLFNTDAKYRDRFNTVLGEHRAMQLSNIEIKTVDGFEGREKEVIIFSTVRNNSGGYIGFLADRRRLNVGLTRAKRGLFVVGSMNTLRKGNTARSNDGTVKVGKGAESWRRYMQYVGEHGLVLNLQPNDALANVLYGNVNAAIAAVPSRT
ncbi:P-loop containing nucleoside triphosphate hydrolase protein [Lentinula aff. detonsa]|nr:P-loop containing nucleoside triphosphate hydrolase protein [Lentinula aff. detonsa]